MVRIDLGKVKFKWFPEGKLFIISERDVRFATEYELYNPKTGGTKRFDFVESTGPEFDPATSYIYKCTEDEYTLEVANDPEITARNAENYLKAKLRE
jgi:hypothetical protein